MSNIACCDINGFYFHKNQEPISNNHFIKHASLLEQLVHYKILEFIVMAKGGTE